MHDYGWNEFALKKVAEFHGWALPPNLVVSIPGSRVPRPSGCGRACSQRLSRSPTCAAEVARDSPPRLGRVGPLALARGSERAAFRKRGTRDPAEFKTETRSLSSSQSVPLLNLAGGIRTRSVTERSYTGSWRHNARHRRLS